MLEFYFYFFDTKRKEKCHINSNVQETKVKWKVRYLSVAATKHIIYICYINKKKIETSCFIDNIMFAILIIIFWYTIFLYSLVIKRLPNPVDW